MQSNEEILRRQVDGLRRRIQYLERRFMSDVSESERAVFYATEDELDGHPEYRLHIESITNDLKQTEV